MTKYFGEYCMKKKKLLLIISAISMCSAVMTIVTANAFEDKHVFALDNETWHHYAAVAPTENMHGSKEFWAKDSEACSTPYFEDPGVTCIDHDFSIYDSFETLTFGDERYVPSLFDHRNAVYPELDNENNTITYGLYPQTNVDSSALLDALSELTTPESNGWYLYEGEYYAKIIATPYDDYQFDNGNTIISGATYWFKCEPITWNILINNSDEYYIFSSVLLDAYRYNEQYNETKDGHYANNYEYSEIRNWLNNDFYNSAFALESSYIQTTVVDNSASTTNNISNPYACINTEDKVFLPSYQDYINSDYGFSTSYDFTDVNRYCKTTDWARARGAWCSLSYQYNGCYWTRSPVSNCSYYAWAVSNDGTIDFYCYVNLTDYCVRPSISLKIA